MKAVLALSVCVGFTLTPQYMGTVHVVFLLWFPLEIPIYNFPKTCNFLMTSVLNFFRLRQFPAHNYFIKILISS